MPETSDNKRADWKIKEATSLIDATSGLIASVENFKKVLGKVNMNVMPLKGVEELMDSLDTEKLRLFVKEVAGKLPDFIDEINSTSYHK